MKSSTFGVESPCPLSRRSCLLECFPIPPPADSCRADAVREVNGVFSAGVGVAASRGAAVELADSSFFRVSPGFAVSSAKSVGTRRIPIAMAGIMRAPNFIVAS
jgi:hypothetical protein